MSIFSRALAARTVAAAHRAFIASIGSLAVVACVATPDDDGVSTGAHELTEVRIAQLAVGRAHACALTVDRAVSCWGASNYGQTGAPAKDLGWDKPTAVEVIPPGSRVRAIAAGEATTCAVSLDGGVSCWGAILGAPPEDGYGARIARTPVDVSGLADVAEVVIGNAVACARTNAGAVLCWGGPDATPVVTIPSGATALGTGWKTLEPTWSGHSGRVPKNHVSWIHALVNGAVYVWGSDIEAGVAVSTPHPLPSLESGVVSMSSSCALKADGAVYCWGPGVIAPNETRPISLGTEDPSVWGSPWKAVEVQGLPAGVTQLATSENASCALTTTGEVWCWGANDAGQVGIGTADSYVSSPTKVTLPDVATQLEASRLAGFCARLTSGAAYCWGDATYGRVGHAPWNGTSHPERGITNDRVVTAPARVTMTESTVVARSMSAGAFYTCGVSREGDGRCWPTSVRRASVPEVPWTFPGETIQIAQRDFGVCAVAKDGHVTCRGGDYDDVPAGTLLDEVVLAPRLACGIRKGTRGLVCWGKELTDLPVLRDVFTNPGPELSAGVQRVFLPSEESYDYQANTTVCALTAAGEVRCFGSEETSVNGAVRLQAAAPHVVQTDVAAVAPSSTCVKKQSGTVLCPVAKMKLAEWAPSQHPWSLHEAELGYGTRFEW